MPQYVLHHQHVPAECGVAYAAFKGHASPLRHHMALASCLFGSHSIWWTVEAENEPAAWALLPFFVARRTEIVRVEEINIP